MSFRKYRLGSYEEMCAAHRWAVPERYNIARDVCDKHDRGRLAMVWEDWRGDERRVSFGELQDLSSKFANALEAHGVERGDRVATLLPSLPETAAVFLGIYKRGAILLSMSILYGDEGVQHRLRDSGTKVLVTDSANRHRIPEGMVERLFVMESPDGGEREAGDLDLREALEKASDRYETADTAADDPAQLYYSSGTTGMAKGILHAHRYLLGHEEFEFCHDVRDGELFHGSGEWAWAAGICPLLGPWRYGAVQFVHARKGGYDPEEHLRVLSKHGVENMFTTPTALRAMTGVSDAGERYPLERLRITCSAGEPLNPEVIRWFREQYGVTVLDYYGLTESYPLCGNFPTVEVREGSMGRPMPGWEVAILDEDERPLPAGERGEICLKARSNPHYPLGYWNRPPEDTEEAFGGEWFHTRDAAQTDEDGYVWYSGRADDVIISAGYRIGPFEVESACVEHPAVKEAAAVASPDPRRGDIVKAFIVLGGGQEPSEELAEQIKRHVRERHSAYAYPREIEFVDDLPKTLTGKIRRIELREAERERKGTQAPA
jgi:acetyl-CoA synthetase